MPTLQVKNRGQQSEPHAKDTKPDVGRSISRSLVSHELKVPSRLMIFKILLNTDIFFEKILYQSPAYKVEKNIAVLGC